jgi:hypothetical protein
MPLEMQASGSVTVGIRDHQNQAVSDFRRWRIAVANHSFSFDHRRRPETLRTAAKPGARIITDGLKSYDGLADSFRHYSIVQDGGKNADAVLPIVHVLFSNVKTWLNGTFHGVSANTHLPTFRRPHIIGAGEVRPAAAIPCQAGRPRLGASRANNEPRRPCGRKTMNTTSMMP